MRRFETTRGLAVMKKQTETMDKLYLEWSQFTSARTAREIAYREKLQELLRKVTTTGVGPNEAQYIRNVLLNFGDSEE